MRFGTLEENPYTIAGSSRRRRYGTLAAVSAASAAAALSVALIGAPEAQAEPDVTADDVREAFAKVEAASQKVNALEEKMHDAQSDISALHEDISRLEDSYQEERADMSSLIVSQQMDQPLGPTISLLGNDDPETFIDGLSSIQALNSSRADDLDAFADSTQELQNRKKQLKSKQHDLRKDKDKADKAQSKIRKDYEKAKSDFDKLKEDEQDKVDEGRKSEGSESKNDKQDHAVKAKGRVKDAIDFAMSHVGDSYSWGGNGPNSWDCSGLTMGAYKAAGVNIGRVTYDQAKKGKEVSMDNLKPGDLVFFDDMSHVGMYVGKGKVVNAARPGVGVVKSGLSGYSFARRIG